VYFYESLLRFYPPSTRHGAPRLANGFFPDFYRSGDPVDVWIKTGYRIQSRGGFFPCGPLKCLYPAQQLESKFTSFLVLFNHTNLKAAPRLTALLNRLVKARKMLQSPLTDCKAFISPKDLNDAKKACQNTLKSLGKDITKVNQSIQNVIQNDPYLKELYEFIESVKGIGPAIATEIIIVTNEFKNINEPKKFACHAGVVPFNYSSGQYKGKAKTSNKANKQLNRAARAGFASQWSDVCYSTFTRNSTILPKKNC
jgi:hypothetical protein